MHWIWGASVFGNHPEKTSYIVCARADRAWILMSTNVWIGDLSVFILISQWIALPRKVMARERTSLDESIYGRVLMLEPTSLFKRVD
jgi:hypothetical protein